MKRDPGGGTGTGQGGRRSRRRRGAKRDRDAVTAEVVVKAAPPPGSRFKGYQDILVRELRLSAEVVRYRRERWLAPSGETVLAPLPAGIVGGFGPGLRRFLPVAHAQGQVTTERLAALLGGIGVEISKRQVVRLLTSRLDDLIAEDREVLRAGLATARWVTVDDTAARHARADGVTTQIGDGRFTAFRTGASKSRAAFLSTLRAGHTEYVIDGAARKAVEAKTSGCAERTSAPGRQGVVRHLDRDAACRGPAPGLPPSWPDGATVSPDSPERPAQIERRAPADRVEVAGEPVARGSAAVVAQRQEEVPVGVGA